MYIASIIINKCSRGQLIEVQFNESVPEGTGQFLPATIHAGGVLGGEQPEVGVRLNRLLEVASFFIIKIYKHTIIF